MQVYKTFLKVMRKYKAGMIMYAIINISMLAAIVWTSKDTSVSVEQKKYSLVVVDEDKSEASQMLYDYLDEIHNIKKQEYTDDQINDLLYYQHIAEYIVIPKGFGEKFMNGKDYKINAVYDEAMPNGIFVNMQINQFLSTVYGYIDYDYSLDEAAKMTKDSMDESKYVSVVEKETEGESKSYTGFLFIPFGIFSILLAGLLPVIQSFDEKEKKNRTAVSACSMVSRNVSIIAACATVALLVMVAEVAVSSFAEADKYLFTGTWFLGVLNVFLYTLMTVMFLFMISPVLSGWGDQAASYATNIFGLSFAFLGGTFVDLDILGEEVTNVSRFTPNYWYSLACKMIWRQDAVFADVEKCFAMELLFAGVCFAVGLAISRFARQTKEA